MIYDLFAFTGAFFFCWLAFTVISVFICVSDETMPGWTLFWGGVSAFVVLGFTSYRPEFNLGDLLYIVPAYALAGCAYACLRWYLLVRDMRAAWDDLPDNPDSNRVGNFAKSFKSDGFRMSVPPSPNDFKNRITTWLAYWPVSVVAWGIGDLVLDFWRWVYRKLAGTLSAISGKAWGE